MKKIKSQLRKTVSMLCIGSMVLYNNPGVANCLVQTIQAESKYTEDGFEYTENEKAEVTITKYTGNNGYVDIAASFPEQKVVKIAASAFENSSIYKVVIPASVMTIDSRAFYQCNNLVEVTWQEGSSQLGAIANYTFYGCDALSSIALPDTICSIGYEAFRETALGEIVIPANCITIGTGAFYSCNNLIKVTVPVSCKTIAQYAFSHCNLDSAVFKGKDTIINTSAFGNSKKSFRIISEPDGEVQKFAETNGYIFNRLLEQLNIAQQANVTEYVYGQEYNAEGLVLEGVCQNADGESEQIDVPLADCKVIGYNSQKYGKQTITYYYGEQSVSYDIYVCYKMSEDTIKVESNVAEMTYSGKEQVPVYKLTRTDNGKTLVEGTDYSIDWGENTIDAGEKTAIITGTGDYKGEFTQTYTIKSYSLLGEEVKVNPIADVTYNGEEQKPSVVVYYNDVLLEQNKDYELEYYNNVENGEASVSIKGINNFTGEKEIPFSIVQAQVTTESPDIDTTTREPVTTESSTTTENAATTTKEPATTTKEPATTTETVTMQTPATTESSTTTTKEPATTTETVTTQSPATTESSATTTKEPATTTKEPATTTETVTTQSPATTESSATTTKEPATTTKQPATTTETTTTQPPATTESSATTTKEPTTTQVQPSTQTSENVQTTQEPTTQEAATWKIGQKFKNNNLCYKITSQNTVTMYKLADKKAKKVIIPDTVTYQGTKFKVTRVGKKACYNHKNLNYIEVGNKVTTIEAMAFANCKKVKKVWLGVGIKTIQKQAFCNDNAVKIFRVKGIQLSKIGRNAIKGIKGENIRVPEKFIPKFRKLASSSNY